MAASMRSKILAVKNYNFTAASTQLRIFVRTGFFDRFRGKKELDFEEELKKDRITFTDRFKGLKKRSGIQTVRGYTPEEDVEERIQAITTEIFDQTDDWKSTPLEDRTKKFQFLTKCQNELDHMVSNMDLSSMKTVDDVVEYFKTEVKDTCAFEDISKLNLPKNLNINLDYSNVISPNEQLPDDKDYVQEVRDVKYRRKYRAHYNKELEVQQN